MAIKKRSTFSDIINRYFEDMEEEFERWRETTLEMPSWNEKTCAMEPLSEIRVLPAEVSMTVDLPMTQESSVQVKPLDERTLEISAEMKRTIRFNELGISHRRGEFRKLYCHKRVPVPVDMDKIRVSFKKGILEVHIPRKLGHKAKKATLKV